VKRLIAGAVLGTALSALAVGTAAAGPAPGGGPEFGWHVAEMAPEHPKDHGRHFGDCVSEMATSSVCDHHE
jgi:hypothetical protein